MVWVLLFLGAAGVYLQSVNGPFFYDDLNLILDNPKMHGLGDLRALIIENLYPQRLIMNLLYGSAWDASGGQTWSFHLLNVLVHLLNAFLLERFLRLGGLKLASGRWVAVGLFLFHPLQTQAVCYIKGLVDLLETLFYLLSFNAILARRAKSFWVLGAVLTLAPWARETALLIPLVLASYLFWVRGENVDDDWKARDLRWATCLALASAAPVLLIGASSHAGAVGTSIYPPLLYLWNMFAGVWIYTRLLFDFGAESVVHEVRPWSTGLVATGALGLLALIASAAGAVRLRKRQAELSFLVFFALVVFGSKCGPLQYMNGFAEYRLYLLNLPVFCLLGLAADKVSLKPLQAALFGAVVLALMVAFNLKYQHMWSDPRLLVEHSLENEPGSRNLLQYRGSFLEQQGRFEEAEQAYLEAARINESEPLRTLIPQGLLAQLYARQQKWAKVEQVLKAMPAEAFASGKPPVQYFKYYLEALKQMRRTEDHERLLREAVKAYPGHPF